MKILDCKILLKQNKIGTFKEFTSGIFHEQQKNLLYASFNRKNNETAKLFGRNFNAPLIIPYPLFRSPSSKLNLVFGEHRN